MNKSFLFLLIVLLLGTGCDKLPIIGKNNRTDGCMGVAYYYIDNQSNRSFQLDFGSPGLNDQLDSATVVQSGQRALIGQGADFGSVPSPISTFSKFQLYATINGADSIIYDQNPVVEALWSRQKRKAGQDFGCIEVDYILVITDELLSK
jgi:hypothetical protein